MDSTHRQQQQQQQVYYIQNKGLSWTIKIKSLNIDHNGTYRPSSGGVATFRSRSGLRFKMAANTYIGPHSSGGHRAT